jgi:outer membrane protein TolC
MADAALARERAEAALRRIIGFPAGQSFGIVTPDSIPNVDADPELAVRQALRNSSTVQQGALDDVQAKRVINQARLNNRFNASINASLGYNQTAPGFSESYQTPLARQTLSMSVNLPMLQWGAGRADVQEATAIDRRTQANNRAQREALQEDARFSALAVQQAQRNLLIAAKADTVAAKQFEVARNRYSIGKISNTDLYNAQTEKDAAVLANVQALRSYWTAFYHLRRVTLYDFATKREIVDGIER